MTHKEYNGWYNYETWLVNLWISNEQGSSSYWADRAEEIYERAEPAKVTTKEEQARFELADELKREFEDGKDNLLGVDRNGTDQSCSVWSDLLGAALSEVNWDEIAGHMIEDVEKEEVEA